MSMQAFTDDAHPIAQRNLADAGFGQRGRPRIEPRGGGRRISHGVVESRHQVRLAETAFADNNHRTTLVWANRLYAFQQVMRGIGDRQKLLGGDLRRSGIRVVGQLDGRTLKALASEFFAEC